MAVPEEDRRAKGLEEAERCFEMAQALNCPFLAAPPRGIHDRKHPQFVEGSKARLFSERGR